MCSSGYFLYSGACIVCDTTTPASTLTCGSTMYATACSAGYYATGGLCVACITGANTCTASGVSTGGCKDGYYFDTSTCKECITGAATCSTAADFTSCKAGWSK